MQKIYYANTNQKKAVNSSNAYHEIEFEERYIYIRDKEGNYMIYKKKNTKKKHQLYNCTQLTKHEICKAKTGEIDTRRNW